MLLMIMRGNQLSVMFPSVTGSVRAALGVTTPVSTRLFLCTCDSLPATGDRLWPRDLYACRLGMGRLGPTGQLLGGPPAGGVLPACVLQPERRAG